GDYVTQLGGVMLSPAPGTADAAMLGPGNGFSGSGVMAVVHFRAIATGSPAIGVQSVIGRDSQNHPLTVTITQQPLSAMLPPTLTELQAAVPNPSRANATLQYSVSVRG